MMCEDLQDEMTTIDEQRQTITALEAENAALRTALQDILLAGLSSRANAMTEAEKRGFELMRQLGITDKPLQDERGSSDE